MRRRSRKYEAVPTPETTYARAKTAGWLLKTLEQNNNFDSCCFECLQWVVGDLRRPLQAIVQKGKKPMGKSGIVQARVAIKEALKRPHDRLASELDDLFEDHRCLRGIIMDMVRRECCSVRELCGRPVAPYGTALKRLERTFGLHKAKTVESLSSIPAGGFSLCA